MKTDTKHLDEIETHIYKHASGAIEQLDREDRAAELRDLAKASADCAKARNELAQAGFFPVYGRFTRQLDKFMDPLLKVFKQQLGLESTEPPGDSSSNPSSNPTAN